MGSGHPVGEGGGREGGEGGGWEVGERGREGKVECWSMSSPFLQKRLMVVGVDVYHDSVHGKSRSITGFVASTNP